MDKIIDIWQKNKILIVLVGILIVCFIAICTVVITYFFGGSKTPDGNRLKDVSKHPITETFKNDYISKLEADEFIREVTFKNKIKDVERRTIYISIYFEGDITLSEAESKASASLQEFPEDLLNFYAINIYLECEASESNDGFTIMGSKPVNKTIITWGNNTKVENEE